MTKFPALSRHLAVGMVFGALIASIILAWYYGWNKGATIPLSVAFVIVLVCVAIGEVLSWHNVAVAWFERRLGACLLWTVLGGVLSLGTLYTNFSTAAGNGDEKAEVHQTAFVTYDNAKDRLAAAKTKRQRLETEIAATNVLVNGRAATTPDAAESEMSKAKAAPLWTATDNCRAYKGRRQTEFCNDYRASEMRRSLSLQRLTLKTEMVEVEKDMHTWGLKAVTRAVVSDDAANITAVARFLKVDNSTARQADSMLLALLAQAMLIFGGILLATESYRHLARKPWFSGRFTAGLGRAWRLFTGEERLPGRLVPPPVARATPTSIETIRGTDTTHNNHYWVDPMGKVFGLLAPRTA